MSQRSPERKAWRQQVLAERPANATAPPSGAASKPWAARDPRLRLVPSAALWMGVTWILQAVFVRLANQLGVVTFLEFSSPITVTHHVGRSGYTTTMTSDHTISWLLLSLLAMVLAFWVARPVFYGDLRATLNTRSAWLVAGWTLALVSLVGLMQLLLPVLGHLPDWLADPDFLDIRGVLIFVVIAAWGQLFFHGWRALMRAAKVPGKDGFDPLSSGRD